MHVEEEEEEEKVEKEEGFACIVFPFLLNHRHTFQTIKQAKILYLVSGSCIHMSFTSIEKHIG